MFRRLFRALFGCSHVDMYRERWNGVLVLVCPDCEHVEPAITREATFHRGGTLPAVVTRTPKVPATVTHIESRLQRVK
jgi:hypothetical protein